MALSYHYIALPFILFSSRKIIESYKNLPSLLWRPDRMIQQPMNFNEPKLRHRHYKESIGQIYTDTSRNLPSNLNVAECKIPLCYVYCDYLRQVISVATRQCTGLEKRMAIFQMPFLLNIVYTESSHPVRAGSKVDNVWMSYFRRIQHHKIAKYVLKPQRTIYILSDLT